MKRVFLLSTALCLVAVIFTANVTNAQTKKTAFLSTYATLADLQANGDDDEAAAAAWFINTYGGVFLSTADVPTTDLSQFNVIWLENTRPDGFSNFPAEYLASAVFDNVQDYYIAGGNLLLTSFGIKYLTELGRVNDAFGEVWEGGENHDIVDDNEAVWGPITTFGRFFGSAYTGDNPAEPIETSEDELFAGLTTETKTDIFADPAGGTYTFIPLIGAGQKEVHRAVWTGDCPSNNGLEGGIDNPAFLTSFESEYNMQALATLEYTLGFFRIAIGRWNAHELFDGKAITINDSGYEWNQNSGENTYQGNIERLTKNALDELGGGVFTAIESITEKARIVKTETYNLNGLPLNTNDLQSLPKGVYLQKQTDDKGNVRTLKTVNVK
jgi:hypothetical protein